MRKNISLTREEVGGILRIAPQTVDRLIVDGRLLCTIADGEPRVPFEQLEAFCRDSLLRVYQSEAWIAAQSDVESIPAILTSTRAAQWQPAAVVDPAMESAGRAPQAADDQASPDRTDDALPVSGHRMRVTLVEPPQDEESAGGSERSTVRTHHANTAAADTSEDEREESHLELRISPRYVPNRQIDGIYDDVKFTILQMSGSGLRIRHTEPLIPGHDAKLSFALLNQAQSFVVRARVVWTSAARYEGSDHQNFYISGLRVTAHSERLARAIEMLRASHELRPDRRVLPERRALPRAAAAAATAGKPSSQQLPHMEEGNGIAALSGVADEDVALVIDAVQRFADEPEIANRWYGRGRFALADEQVRRDAPRKPRDREEVLAVWEYLERRVELLKVVEVVSWLRDRRPRAGTAPPS